MNPPRCTHVPILNPLPPPSPYHPSGSSQCTSPKHPVSCIQPRLAIHFLYDIIHFSMPFSQNIPPSTSPIESKIMFHRSAMFFAALFIIARTWKQPRCPSVDEWIRKQWYIYTMEYYSAIKKDSLKRIHSNEVDETGADYTE